MRALFEQAWELRGTPYLRDAVEHMVEWRANTNLRHMQRAQARDAAMERAVELMRSTYSTRESIAEDVA